MLTGLKVIGCFFVGSVAGIPVVGQMGDSLNPTLHRLGAGSAQMVLAVAVLSLSGVFMFIGRKLIKSYEDRVAESKERLLEADKKSETLQHIITQNSVALASSALAAQQFKDSIYHLANVIEKCPGTTGSETISDKIRNKNQ